MHYRKFLILFFIVCFWLPQWGYAAVPDSIRSALGKLKDEPLRQFQNNLLQQLRDGKLPTSVKEGLVDDLLQAAFEHKRPELRSTYAYTSGLIYQYIFDNGAMALYAYDVSFQSAQKLNNRSEMAAGLWQSMSTLADLQLYDEALRYLFKVEAVLQQYNYTGFEAIAEKMLQMGSLFFNTGNYDVAIQYYEKAFSFRDFENDKRALMYASNTLGLAYQRVQQYEKAVERFEQSYQLSNELGERFWSALTYGNMGAVYFEQGRYDDALGHLLFDIDVSQELGVWNSAANACILVARIYRLQQKTELAKKYLQLADELDAKNSVWKTRNSIYEQCALLYADLGDFQNALISQMAFKALSDTMNNDRLQKEQLMLSRKHRFEIQNQERVSREQSAALEARLDETRRLNWAFAFISLLLITAFVLQYKRNENLRKRQTTIFRKEIQKKEFALLQKEIKLQLIRLLELKEQGIPLKPFLPDAAYWEDFKHKFDGFNEHFFSRTKSNHPDLMHQDILWLALLKLKFTEADIQLLFDTELKEWLVQISRKLGAKAGSELSQLVESL